MATMVWTKVNDNLHTISVGDYVLGRVFRVNLLAASTICAWRARSEFSHILGINYGADFAELADAKQHAEGFVDNLVLNLQETSWECG